MKTDKLEQKLFTREDAEKQIDALRSYFDKIDELVRQRFFSDPRVWEIIEVLDSDTYTKITELASYYLSCEIEKIEPISAKDFQSLEFEKREALLDHVYQILLPGEPMP